MKPPHLRPKPDTPKRPPRKPLRVLMAFVSGMVALMILLAGLYLGSGQLPDAWNPFTPLDPRAEITPVTTFKLSRTAADPQLCLAALEDAGTAFTRLADQEESEQCHIRTHVRLSKAARASLRPVSTRCDIALRMAMWDRHSIQPAARAHFGQEVAALGHYSSYSCRTMRTGKGPSRIMSAHATARAIDISSVVLADGRTLRMKDTWDRGGDAGFWRDVRDGACRWFRTVLSPDYNALHADHFHLAQGRWGTCR